MLKLVIIANIFAGLTSPAAAIDLRPANFADSVQSVYRTERVIEVMNYDGTVSETTIVTRYFVFGYE